MQVDDPALRETVVSHAKELVAATIANDKGCLGYDFFESTTRAGVYMFCESWESADALDTHSAASHFVYHVGEIQKLATLKIESFEK